MLSKQTSPRTLEQVKAGLERAKKTKADVALARAMLRHGNLTPEAYRYVEGFLPECPECGLLHGHRYPCVE